MRLSLHIKNFGKIKKADIAIDNLTVFGGTNNIGKSYASRALYAIFDTRNTNTTDEYFEFLLGKIINATDSLSESVNSISDRNKLFVSEKKLGQIEEPLHKLIDLTANLHKKLSKDGADDEFRIEGSSMIDSSKELITMLDKLNGKNKQPHNGQYIASRREGAAYMTNNIVEELNEFKSAINLTDEEVLRKGYTETLTQNFLHNFQIRGLSELIGKQQYSPAKIVIKENDVTLIGVSISPKGELKLDIASPDSLKHLEKFSRVVYLESPMYWKLERPLIDASRTQRRYVSDSPEEILSGVPKYFNDAHKAMTVKKKDKPFIEHDIEKIIGGKIIRNERDDLIFVEKGAKKAISLPLTASGVIQLGMLGHLIETRVIQEDSILFIDEPEAHLHPDWQSKIIEVLYKLSEAGVMVIIATHSPVIMEWIKVQVKENPESKEYIALNSFHKDAEFDCIKKGYEDNMDEIIQDLTETLSRLYIREL